MCYSLSRASGFCCCSSKPRRQDRERRPSAAAAAAERRGGTLKTYPSALTFPLSFPPPFILSLLRLRHNLSGWCAVPRRSVEFGTIAVCVDAAGAEGERGAAAAAAALAPACSHSRLEEARAAGCRQARAEDLSAPDPGRAAAPIGRLRIQREEERQEERGCSNLLCAAPLPLSLSRHPPPSASGTSSPQHFGRSRANDRHPAVGRRRGVASGRDGKRQAAFFWLLLSPLPLSSAAATVTRRPASSPAAAAAALWPTRPCPSSHGQALTTPTFNNLNPPSQNKHAKTKTKTKNRN